MSEWRYAEQILYVDLTRRTFRVEPTDLELKRSYIGGAGFVARLLAAESAPGAVAMAGGPLSDGIAGRLALGARTGGSKVAVSSLGGRMAAALKEAGYDAVVLTGRLDRPATLLLSPDGVQFEDATGLWGLEVPPTEQALNRDGHTALVLGPAAENQVPFATLAHEGHHAGGSGVAAALGAQRLKAIVAPAPAHIPSRCDGCTLKCAGLGTAAEVTRAGALGLDAPTAARLAALAEGCARAGLLPHADEPLTAIAHRMGIGGLLAEGEAAALAQLGPEAAQIAAALPAPKRRHGLGMADLLGTCQRVWREHPGQVLREALVSTQGLLRT